MATRVPSNEIDVPVKHGMMHCLIQGQGDPIVLLHGALGTGQAHFPGQIEAFSTNYQVIAPDFLGYGSSGRRVSFDPNFHHQDAEDVGALLEYLHLPPLHLCGFSDGAVIAMIAAGMLRDSIRSLVLVGGQTLLDEQVMEVTRQWSLADQLPQGFQDALARRHGDPYWREMVVAYVSAVERLYENGGEMVSNHLNDITCPTLIVHGENDPWVNPLHAHKLYQVIRGSELEFMPSGGHDVQRESPEAFNALVLKFLSKH